MATIREIAERAGVSRALVSRVLNNKPGVSPENRRRILEAIEEAHYVPNALARSLATRTTQNIGVVMDDLCEKYFFDLITGLQDMGEELGYNVVFCSGRSRMDIKFRYVDYFLQGRADGIIAFGSRLEDAPLYDHIMRQTLPFVLIEGDTPGGECNRVRVNNTGGAYRATKHLIESGRKRIVHFTGDMGYNVSKERLDGFLAAMRDHGAVLLPHAVVPADFEEPLACQRMDALIREGHVPDACFVGADKAAYGVLRALAEHGLRVPEDVAVVGFDDEQPDSRDRLFPRLTTMRQPLYEMGQAGIRLLVNAIGHPEATPQSVVFEPELIIGETG